MNPTNLAELAETPYSDGMGLSFSTLGLLSPVPALQHRWGQLAMRSFLCVLQVMYPRVSALAGKKHERKRN